MGEKLKRIKEIAPYAAPAAAGGALGGFVGLIGIAVTQSFTDFEVTRAGWAWTEFFSTAAGAAILSAIFYKSEKDFSDARVTRAEERAEEAERRLRKVRDAAAGR